MVHAPDKSMPDHNAALTVAPAGSSLRQKHAENTRVRSTDPDDTHVISSPTADTKSTTFHFLNFDHPSQARSSKIRKSIRSHVTRRQHRIQRASEADLKKDAVALQRLPLEHSSSTSDSETTRQDAAGSRPTMPAFESTGSDESIASLQPRIDLTDVFPTRLHSYVRDSLEFYYTVMMPDVPFLNADAGDGYLRTAIIPFLLSEPVSLHALVVFIAPFFQQARGTNPPQDVIDILTLRGLAIRSINDNLAALNSSEPPSDHIITAVNVLGYYEFVIGERETSRKHQDAVYQMVVMRGGLSAMGLDGLLERLMIWMDLHMAYISESEPHYKEVSISTLLPRPRLDIDLFFRPFSAQAS